MSVPPLARTSPAGPPPSHLQSERNHCEDAGEWARFTTGVRHPLSASPSKPDTPPIAQIRRIARTKARLSREARLSRKTEPWRVLQRDFDVL